MTTNNISAKIITDSLNPRGKRLTTFILRFPRIILAELNTHRAFSRNSSSSRAIPFEKMIKMVKEDPFIPIRFQKDHKGMQGTEYFEVEQHEQCIKDWISARDKAVEAATSFVCPVTKQLRNRILEPFMWHTAIVSATDFENFFALRAHKDAEIHIAELAEKMLEAYNNSTPKQLNNGDFHIPLGDSFDEERLKSLYYSDKFKIGKTSISQLLPYTDLKIRIAIARCARISYVNYEGKDDYETDMKTCDKLFGSIPRHLSPTEHVAEALDSEDYIGNFCGFKQYRYMFEDQNLTDSRVIKK